MRSLWKSVGPRLGAAWAPRVEDRLADNEIRAAVRADAVLARAAAARADGKAGEASRLLQEAGAALAGTGAAERIAAAQRR